MQAYIDFLLWSSVVQHKPCEMFDYGPDANVGQVAVLIHKRTVHL